MKVHILSAYPEAPIGQNNIQAQWVRESAAEDTFHRHFLCEDPDAADLILFVENHPDVHDPLFFQVRSHPLWKRYRSKCFLYHDSDSAPPFFPGLYPSLSVTDARPYQSRASPYIARIEINQGIKHSPLTHIPPLLFSFMGSQNCKARQEILKLKHPDAFLRDTQGQYLWLLPFEEKQKYTQIYGEVLRDSCFVLCPGGNGPSSYRLYETMESGRTPIIISDLWVAPEGPSWNEFSVRIAESDIPRIPEILANLRPSCIEMGRKARVAWEQWFAKPVVFHRMVEWCLAIERDRRKTSFLVRRSHGLRLILRYDKTKLLRCLKRTLEARLGAFSKKRNGDSDGVRL